MKKLISYFLSLAVAISACAMGASAEGFTYEFEKNCKALFMVRMDTGLPVYSFQADERLPMASLTKIMSYIVAYENIPNIETTKVIVDESVAEILNATGSSLSGVLVGEELTVLELLNLMMVPSGNDAALVLAQYIDSLPEGAAATPAPTEKQGESGESDQEGANIFEGGTVTSQTEISKGTEASSLAYSMPNSRFVRLMNEKAAELGCLDTHFTNPHGLHHPDHYATARDLATISRYATTLPYFTEITGSTSYTLRATNKSTSERTLTNTNSMLLQYQDEGQYYYTKTTGIKTGSLDESGYCIAASAQLEGDAYIAIALGSPMVDAKGDHIDKNGAMLDAAEIFEWAFTKLRLRTLASKGDLLGDVQLQYAWNKDKLQLVAESNVQTMLPKDVSVSSFVVTVDLPEKVQAPVKKGDILGTASFAYADETIATVNVVAAESVERSEIVQTLEVGKEIVTSPVFLVIAGIVVLILSIYFLSIVVYNHKKKKMRKVKNYRDL